jgi:MFS family permease
MKRSLMVEGRGIPLGRVLAPANRGAAGFLGWIFVKSLGEAPWSQRWSLIAIVIVGLVLLLVARFVLRSSFFQLQRESE